VVAIDASSSTAKFTSALRSEVNKLFGALMIVAPPDEIRVTAIVFHHKVSHAANFAKIGDVDVLETFEHGHGTALYAAALNAIDTARDQIGMCLDGPVAPKVAVAVITDGFDSCSARVLPMLQQAADRATKEGIALHVIGLDVDALEIARTMHFPLELATSAPASEEGTRSGTLSLTTNLLRFFSNKDQT